MDRQAWCIGQERIPSRKPNESPSLQCSSTVPRHCLTINLTEMLKDKPATVKNTVRIRPPSPKASLLSREFESRRGQSYESLPKPIIRRRSRSLPTTTERKSHSRNVGVRFVDSLGLDLEAVKVFKTGEDPFVPQHVTFRSLMGAELASGNNLEISLPYFKPVFTQQPGDKTEFISHLYNQKVCLERVFCFELGIIGITQVLNLHVDKEVSARYSFTEWKSWSETKASWVSTITTPRNGTDGLFSCDTFRFHLPVPPFLKPGAVLEFAIRYKVNGNEYWDNNEGQNYKLVCHNYKLVVPKECEDSMVHFI